MYLILISPARPTAVAAVIFTFTAVDNEGLGTSHVHSRVMNDIEVALTFSIKHSMLIASACNLILIACFRS